MKKILNFLVIFALLLSACTLQIPALFGARIINVEYQDLENLAIYLRNADDGYVVKVGDYIFDCSVDETDPDLLVCVGPGFEPGEELVVKFFDGEGGGDPLAELSFTAPDIPEEYKDTDNDGVPNNEDECPTDSLKSAPGECGCGKFETDSDGDGIPDCKDEYPSDPENNGSKPEETKEPDPEPDVDDADGDGVPDEEDKCPEDPDKAEPGKCGCGVADSDEDEDGIPDCEDECPALAYQDKIGDPCDKDEDNDGYNDGGDQCPYDPNKFTAGYCGCGKSEKDSDGDGYPDCVDQCPENPNKIEKDEYGCEDICGGTEPVDTDGDGTPDCEDLCPEDPMKIEPGVCGCNKTEDADDNDGDGIPNCKDICPEDPDHVNTDGDAWPDCYEDCDFNPEKKHEGLCGCGCPETTGCTDPDFDGDLICDCWDLCPETEGIFQYPDYGCPEPI